MKSLDKKADLAGPGVSTYEEVEKILPLDYRPILDPKETQLALHAVKRYIEDNLCKALNLFHVEVPLIVDRESGVNDYLDRDGSRTPVEFPCGLGLTKRIDAQVVQAATKWKRMALKQFVCKVRFNRPPFGKRELAMPPIVPRTVPSFSFRQSQHTINNRWRRLFASRFSWGGKSNHADNLSSQCEIC